MSQKTLGIILAAGKSSRLYPATFAATKQVLPVYDKPLIYYPLSTLMLAGIRDFVIIVNPDEEQIFIKLFKDCGELLGIETTIIIQDQPRGLPDAFNMVAEQLHETYLNEFSRFALILGDNIYYGAGMSGILTTTLNTKETTIFATKVLDPERFGVIELDKNGSIVSIEEKPLFPKSNLAVTGLYFFNSSVFQRTKTLNPSKRGELEITELIKTYFDCPGSLACVKLPRGSIWFDTGTTDSLLEASNYIQTIQKHHGFMVGNPHEIAYNNGWINWDSLRHTAKLCEKSAYGKYLLELLETKDAN